MVQEDILWSKKIQGDPKRSRVVQKDTGWTNKIQGGPKIYRVLFWWGHKIRWVAKIDLNYQLIYNIAMNKMNQ